MSVVTDDLIAYEVRRRSWARASIEGLVNAIEIPRVPSAPFDPEHPDVIAPIETKLAQHHQLMCAALQRAYTTPNYRLMIFTPPGAAKSTYGSVVGPTWLMGKKPGTEVVVLGYDSDLPMQHSRRARAIVRDPAYRALWPERPVLSNDKGAQDNWQLTNGSSMIAAGILAGVTGYRAHLIDIDDPVKNREQADSRTEQDKRFDEYNDTVSTRLYPGGSVVLTQTRWSELDISSRLLPEDYDGESGLILCRDGQLWEVLNIPAKARRADDPLGRKIGEYLWPEWFKPGHWDKWEKNPLALRSWEALCQQNPVPREGINFSEGDFLWYDPDLQPSDAGEDGVLPHSLHFYGASDYATMEGRGDFTEHGVGGVDWKGDIWLTDWWYGQKETDVSIEHFVRLVRQWRPRRWGHEGGVIDHAIGPAVRRTMREKNAFTMLIAMPSISDKAAKLLSFNARAKAHTIHLPLRREWARRLVAQLIKFPAVAHDDAADVCGLLGRMVDQMVDAERPLPPERQFLTPFTERWFTAHDEADRVKPRYTSRG